jgi:hypothetical protein
MFINFLYRPYHIILYDKEKNVVIHTRPTTMFVDVIRRKNTQKEVDDMFKIPDFGGKFMLRQVDGDEI